MADWGLYTALRGTDNWAQRRADKQMNMQIVQQQKADQERKVEKSMLAEEKINEYLDEMANLDVLPEDQERIQQVEKDSRANIITGIANYNGDLARYISSGGISDLHEYRNSITQSAEVQTALSNKENMAKIIADKQKGNRYFAPVQVEQTSIDPETGEEISEMVTTSVDKQIDAFKRGDISTIAYNGSEDKVELNAFTFHNTPKDPQNPYSEDNLVTTSDIKFWAMSKNASEDYADALADNYAERVNAGGDPWYWGNLSAEDKAIAEYKSGKGKSGGGSSKTMGLDAWYNNIKSTPPGQMKPIPALERNYMYEQKGMMPLPKSESIYGGSYRYAGPAFGRDNALNGKKVPIDVSTAEIISGSEKYVNIGTEARPEYGMMVTMVFGDDDPNIAPGWFINDKAIPGEENNFKNENNRWTGQVIVSIDEEVNSPAIRAEMNKRKGLTNANVWTPATGGNQMDDEQRAKIQAEAELNDERYGFPPGTTMQSIMNQK